MIRRPSPSPSLHVHAAIAVAALALSGGCVRRFTIDPELAAARDEGAWKIRGLPGPAVREAGAIGPSTAATQGAPATTSASTPEATPPSPDPVAAAPVTPSIVAPATRPLLFREQPNVELALRSPRDSFGVPTALYEIDPLLAAHRKELQSQTSARRSVASGTIVAGVLFGAVSAWALSVGLSRSNSPDSGVRDSADRAIFWGGFAGLLSLGQIVGGVALAATSSNPTWLERYYRETYSDPR